MFALCASCAKEGPTGPIGPAGPSFTNGYITGFVDLYDIYGSQILIDSYYAKVELSLSGATSLTPTIAIATDTTYPAISGQYTEQNMFYRYKFVLKFLQVRLCLLQRRTGFR